MTKSVEAYHELIRVLEEAVRGGATSVELEWESRDLIVYFMTGSTGIGEACFSKELEVPVLDELAARAKLGTKSRGVMPVTLLGEKYEVHVKMEENFDNYRYSLMIKSPRATPSKKSSPESSMAESDSKTSKRKRKST